MNPNRVQCNYLHRIPPPNAILPNSATDIFGREKHADYKDDMGGTGSFSRQNRTCVSSLLSLSSG